MAVYAQRGLEKGLVGRGSRTSEGKKPYPCNKQNSKQKEYMKCDQKFYFTPPEIKTGYTPQMKIIVIWFYYTLVSFHSRMQTSNTAGLKEHKTYR